MQASLQLSLWCCCLHCTGTIANIARVLLPLMHWRHWPYCTDLFPLTLHGRCHRCSTGIVVPSSWRVCTVALELLPLLHWHCHPWYTGISTLVAQTFLPLLCFCYAVDSQASLPLLSWHVLSRGQCGRPHQRQRQHRRKKGNNTSTTREATPAQWGQWCQHKEGDNASAIEDVRVIRTNTSTTRGTMQLRW